MVASSNQQETVMDTQKVELRALSDDQLDAVSGGDAEQKQQEREDKAQSDQIKAFQQLLQQI
jgi:hypothetical protein